jgi:hypothetical protein
MGLRVAVGLNASSTTCWRLSCTTRATEVDMARSVCVALIGVVALHVGYAQGHPDFSGHWILDETRSASAHYPGFVGPIALNIALSDSDLRIEVTRGDKTTTDVYRVFSSPEAASAAGPPAAPSFRSHWEGPQLVSETVRNVDGSTVRTREVRSLSADGTEMVVDATVIVEHGYTLAGARNYGTGKDVYKRKP